MHRQQNVRRFNSRLVSVIGLVLVLSGGAPQTGAAAYLITFDDPSPTDFDNFGFSVAIDGISVLIGAPGHNLGDPPVGPSIGQAHLFEAVTGNLLRTFDDPTPELLVGDLTAGFGASVALDDNKVLIGHPGDDTLGVKNGTIEAWNIGQAHLFDATSGAVLQTFDNPNPTIFDYFGDSVAIEDDRVLIGSPSTLGIPGQAYLFDATSGNLLQTFNEPTPLGDDRFGSAVALNGNHVLIGAPGDNSSGENVGQAHLFNAATGNRLQTFDDPTPTGYEFNGSMFGDDFGFSVALEGNNVFIGAPGDSSGGLNAVGQVHLFSASTGALLDTYNDPSPVGLDNFGFSLAIDANSLLIGAPFDSSQGWEFLGQAHLFDAFTGALLDTFNDPTPFGFDYFGYSVAVDTNSILIGAANDSTQGTGVGQAHLASVYEPPMLALFGLGLAGLGYRRRQIKKA